MAVTPVRASARIAGAPPTPPPATPPAGARNAIPPPPAPINVTVAGAGLDMYIPTIPEVQESDIMARFKYQHLTEIEGRPDYTKLYNARRELCGNALAVKCSFRGGKYGTLGVVLEDAVYQAETGVAWTVPASQGAYPSFA